MSEQGPPPDAAAPAGEPGPTAPRPATAVPVKKAAAKKAPAKKAAAKKAPPQPPDDQAAAMRGLAVIVATVVIGLVIFAAGLRKSEQGTDVASTNTTTTLNVPTTDRDAAPVVTKPDQGTTVPAKPPATKVPPKDLKVMVVNGVDPSKTIAGPNADKLKTEKYTIAGTADLTPAVDTSAVYYSGDLQAEALAVAKVLGIPASQVQPMPAKPPANLNGADILVVIGKDKA